MEQKIHRSRCVVIVGPQGVGKTTLLSQMIRRAGAEPPAFDCSAEAKDFGMTTEPNFARFEYLGEKWTAIDCPGSIELLDACLDFMAAADVVVVVADPDPDRAGAITHQLKFLDDHAIPHVIFINRVDEARARFRELLEALQAHSARPLVLRQAPLWENGKIVGAVDLVSERAWRYREGAPSDLIEVPESDRAREREAREFLLDTLADFDDALMEKILEDRTPADEEVFALMAKELEEDQIAPVTIGSALHANGVTRLLKLLRHEVPNVDKAAWREHLNCGENVVSVIRTMYAPHVGKLSLARVWKGIFKEGASINGSRASGIFILNGDVRTKIEAAAEGDVFGIPKIDALESGDAVVDGAVRKASRRENSAPLFAQAIKSKSDRDEVRLSAALQKLTEEDQTLGTERRVDTGEIVLMGRGDIHLRLAAAKLRNRYNVDIETRPPKASYRETIRAAADYHARHKKQSGGHGQFADIKVKIAPLTRGAGFHFDEAIHGGSVPKQFIPAVEAGVKEQLATGPLGFPVVDVSVTLYDGQFHSVDSNEMSFKMAGRLAVREALPACQPVLLEPIYQIVVHTPSAHTNKVHGVISSRRGQILGFDARDGWRGWDSVTAMMPESGVQDLIIELRSITHGAATFESKFDHYQELHGRDADRIVEERRREMSI